MENVECQVKGLLLSPGSLQAKAVALKLQPSLVYETDSCGEVSEADVTEHGQFLGKPGTVPCQAKPCPAQLIQLSSSGGNNGIKPAQPRVKNSYAFVYTAGRWQLPWFVWDSRLL